MNIMIWPGLDQAPQEQFIFRVIHHKDNDYSDTIISEVCRYLNVDTLSMYSPSRKRELVEARQIAMYFMLLHTNLPLKAVGAMFGWRDHSTVIYARQTVQDLMDTNKVFKTKVYDIELILLKKYRETTAV